MAHILSNPPLSGPYCLPPSALAFKLIEALDLLSGLTTFDLDPLYAQMAEQLRGQLTELISRLGQPQPQPPDLIPGALSRARS